MVCTKGFVDLVHTVLYISSYWPLDRRIYRVCVSSSSVRIDSCRARSNEDTSACEPAELDELFRSILLAPREIGRAIFFRESD